MTLFGWLTVFVWFWGAFKVTGTTPEAVNVGRIMCIFMGVGTLVWGTGHL